MYLLGVELFMHYSAGRCEETGARSLCCSKRIDQSRMKPFHRNFSLRHHCKVSNISFFGDFKAIARAGNNTEAHTWKILPSYAGKSKTVLCTLAFPILLCQFKLRTLQSPRCRPTFDSRQTKMALQGTFFKMANGVAILSLSSLAYSSNAAYMIAHSNLLFTPRPLLHFT